MTTTFITPDVLARAEYAIEASGVVDLLCPERQPGEVGRIGLARTNTFLWCLGVRLCASLGHETTIDGVHNVLTRFLTRNDQWRLGVLRRAVSAPKRLASLPPEPDWYTPVYGPSGKRRKIRWGHYEQVGYDDLVHVVDRIRARFDYGYGSAPDLDDTERKARAKAVGAIVDALLAPTLIDRPHTGTYYAIDATGQWAWSRGSSKVRRKLEDKAKNHNEDTDGPLEVGDIILDDDDPADEQPPPHKSRCLDAAWGYRTTKDGQKGPGFGFHLHTIVRVPHPDAGSDSEPRLVEVFILTPANADVVTPSLNIIDRLRARARIKILLGDSLYTHLKAERWQVELFERGIEQVLFMRSGHHTVVPILGGLMQHRWLHCPAAPMDQRPLPPDRATDEEWEENSRKIEEFQYQWAMVRKEAGLSTSLTTKWICPARAGRVACPALGKASYLLAKEAGLPPIEPPVDWESRPCCTKASVDFTPDPTDPNHQVKLAQREYYGGSRWRRKAKRRAMVEGVFGILKNPSRQRMTRGQNRVAGLAVATILTAIKNSLYNEQQLRDWHERTGEGPGDHPLLQPDQKYEGHSYLTPEQAAAVDQHWIAKLEAEAKKPRAA